MSLPLCSRCSAPLGEGALSGQCPRCLGALAFGTETELGGSILHRSGDYEFRRELGRGGMGVVYEARQISLNRRVAVKMLLSGVFARPNVKPRFRAEAEAAARLRHPGVVTIHEVGELEGEPFFAMELIEGPSLADLTREKPLPGMRAARYLRLVSEAIAHAHAAGVLHRDLKPSNVLVDASDQPRVTDFGLAKLLDSTAELTRTGEVMGSPNYLPPEQVSGGAFDATGDVYSLGAILYQLLTARPPFVADTVAATLQQVLHSEPVPPRQLNPAVPRDLETICLKCLQKEPARRYAGAAALAADLSRFENAQPIEARPVSGVERLVLWCCRKPALAILTAALALALTSGITGILWQWQHARLSRDAMRLNLYAADMAAASIAVRQGDLGGARDLLARYLPGPDLSGSSVATAPEARADQAGVDLRGFEWRLLWRNCQSGHQATLGTHPWIVNCVAVSPDDRWLTSGSQDQPDDATHSLKLWSLDRRELIAALPATGTVWSVAFTPDSRQLMSAGSGGVQFWEVPSGRELTPGPALKGQMAALAARAPVLVASPWHPAGASTLEPLVWLDLRTGIRRSLPISGWFPALSPDGRQLAFLDARRDVQLWDLESAQPIRTLATNRNLFTLRFSPDGRRLAAAGRMTHARVWDLNQPALPPQLFAHERNVWLAEFSPDGRALLTAGSDQMIRLWDLASGRQTQDFRGHRNEVRTAAFSADGQFIASGSKDQSVRLWTTRPRTNYFTTRQSELASPLFSPDGSRFVSTIENRGAGVATVWQWKESRTASRDEPRSADTGNAVSTNGEATPIGTIPGWPRGFAPDGRHLLVYHSESPRLEWWLPNGREAERTVRLAGTPAVLEADECGVSGHGALFFLGDSSGGLWLWDTTTGVLRQRMATTPPSQSGEDRRRFSAHYFSSVAMDRAGRWLAAGLYSDPAVFLCEVATARIHRLTGHRDWTRQVAFAPDGRTLASGNVDGTIRLWDIATARKMAVLPGHLEETSAIAFSSDGRTLASLNYGMELKLWHLPTRREVAVFPMLNAGLRLAFSPDGRRLAIHTDDGNVAVWEAPFAP